MTHRPSTSTLTALLRTRLGLSPNSTARASKSRARHLLAPFAVAAMLLGLAGNANAQALSFGAEPSIDDQVYTVGQAVDVTLPPATGGVAPLTYSLTRANGNAIPPPRGVVINPTDRTLRGTPLQVAEAVSYRWTVTDSASPPVMQHIPFTITVNAAPVANIAPAFVAGASIEAATFYQDTNITPLTLPRATGGEGAITYALTPAIPGMFFDTVTGVLSGAPTTAAAATTYTYTAGDTDGSAPGTDESSLTISITVLANTIPTFGTSMIVNGAVTIVFPRPRFIFTVGTPVNQTLPVATGGDGEIVYTLGTRPLPAGLTFDGAATPPTISGTPTTASSSVTYRYNADDSDANEAGDDGSSLSFRITIRGAAATGITMSIRDLAGNPLTSLNEGDDPTTFRLYFDTVPALSGFTADQDVAITVSTPVAGQVGYTAAGIADFIDRDVASTESRQLQLTVTDDDVATADGVVTYTATVSPSGFTATAMITLVDNEISIVTTPAAVTLATGSTADYTVQLDQEPPGSVTVSVASVADAIATVSRNTRTFTAANWNVPASVTVTGVRGGSTTISHSATAAGGFGYQSTDVMVTVTPVAVNFPAGTLILDQTFRVGTAVDLTLPTATGATTYRLSSHADQSLPAGLTFDGATRVLSGMPTAAQTAEGYAYSARNPDNLDNRNFDITVVATGTPPTSFTVSITPDMVTESATATNIEVTVTLTGGTYSVARVFRVLGSADTATGGGVDYSTVPATNVTIPANMASGSATIAFTATVDAIAEPGGEIVRISASLRSVDLSTGDSSLGSSQSAPLTINDPVVAPTPPTSQTLTLNPTMVTESATPTDITATVTLTGGAYNVARSFSIGSSSGSATEGTDYTALSNVVLTIPANAGSGTVTFPFTAADDMVVEGGGEALNIRSTLQIVAGTDPDTSLAVANAIINISDPVAANTAPAFADGATVAAQTFTTSTAVNLSLPTATGGNPPITYTLLPAIPGLDLDAATGVLSGTPTTVAGATMHTYTAADGDSTGGAGDEDSLTFSVTVVVAPTPPTSQTLTLNPSEVTESATPTNIMATVTLVGGTYAIDRVFSFGSSSGTAIERTDYTAPQNVNLTVPATMTSGTTTFPFSATVDAIAEPDGETLTIRTTLLAPSGSGGDRSIPAGSATLTINDPVGPGTDTAPTFGAVTISPQTFTVGAAVDLALPTATGGEGAITYTLTPAIPGLELDAATGALTGTPTTAAVAADHTYTAGDTDGSVAGTDEATLTISITVNAAAAADTAPTFGTTVVAAQVYSVGTAVNLTLPAATDGNGVITYTLTPTALAAGLSFNAAANPPTITGTPNTQASATTYTYTATDEDGDDASLAFAISVGAAAAADTAPAFADDASVNPRSYSRFVAIPPYTLPQATGGNGDITYTLTPAIPGLTLDADTGVLTGTPTTQAPLAPYTLTAADSDMTTGPSDEATFTFEVVVHPLTEATGWQLGIVPAVVAESETATELTVTASYTRNGRSADERVATFQTQGGVATAGTDYIAVPPTTITIPALATNASTTVSFMATPDMVTETGNESVFFVGTLQDSAGDPVTLTYTGGTLFIQDPPPVPTSVTLSVNPAMVSESADATTITVTATLDGGRFAEERRVTLSADNASTATVTTDYTPAITHTITIPALATSGSVEIPFTAVMDTETEAGGETVIIQRNLATSGGTAALSRDITVTPVTLTINDPAADTTPTFGTETVTAQVYARGTAVNLTLPTVTDGNGVITYTLAPTALAGGLTFNPAANPPTITGTPNTQASPTTYTYTATDEDGDDASLMFDISVGASMSTPPTTQTLTISPTMVTESATATDITATVTLTGGTYNVERLFNIRTTQSGAATAATDYTVFSDVVLTIPASMASGSQTFPFTAIDDMTADDGETLSIDSTLLRFSGLGADTSLAVASATLTINDPVAGDATPAFANGARIPTQDFTVGVRIASLSLPQATGGDAPLSYTLTPALSAGLTFDGTARTITGTPTTAATLVTYRYTATDMDGDTATLTFRVTVVASTGPTFGGATISAQAYFAATTITPVTLPAATGGTGAITYTLTPAIPGLTLNPTSRVLTGTPTTVAGATMHTYTATDGDMNTATLMFSITIDAADTTPAFTAGATVSAQTFTMNTAITPLTLPVATGGNGAIVYTLTPAIPGLILDSATGVLSGTPTTVAGATTHTYTAGDSDDNRMSTDEVSLMFSITVVQAPPTRIDLSVSPTAVTESGTATPVTVTATLIDGAFTAERTITVASTDGTATAADYTAVSNTVLTIPANMASASVDIMFTATVDTIAEPAGETVLIGRSVTTGTGAVDSDIPVTPATLTINDYARVTVNAGADQSVGYGAMFTLNGTVPTSFTNIDTTWALTNGSAARAALVEAGLGATEAQMEVTRLTTALTGMAAMRTVTLTAPTADPQLTGPVPLEFTITVTDNDAPAGQPRTNTDTVTITVQENITAITDTLNQMILPEITRALLNSTAGSITQRIEQAATGTKTATLTLNGRALSLTNMANAGSFAEALNSPGVAETLTAAARGLADGSWQPAQLFGNSSFVLPLNAGELGVDRLMIWGRGDYRNVSGKSNGMDWDGDLISGRVGADAQITDTLLAGLALSQQGGAFDYEGTQRGTYNIDQTSIHPYLGWSDKDGRRDAWITLGFGWGEVEIDDQDEDGLGRQTANLITRTIGGGGSALVLESGMGTLRLKGEVLQTRADVDDNAIGIAEMNVDATRVRVTVEGARNFALANGAFLKPTVEVGLRHDAGDGRNGTGAEIGGGLRFTDPAQRLTLEGQWRVLVAHSGDYGDWGISGMLRFEPGIRGQGLAVSLQPSYGATASRVAALWAQEGAVGTSANAATPRDGQMNVTVSYGMDWADGMLTPYSRLLLTDAQTQAYRIGGRLQMSDGLAFNLEGLRQQTATQPVDHGILLKLQLDW